MYSQVQLRAAAELELRRRRREGLIVAPRMPVQPVMEWRGAALEVPALASAGTRAQGRPQSSIASWTRLRARRSGDPAPDGTGAGGLGRRVAVSWRIFPPLPAHGRPSCPRHNGHGGPRCPLLSAVVRPCPPRPFRFPSCMPRVRVPSPAPDVTHEARDAASRRRGVAAARWRRGVQDAARRESGRGDRGACGCIGRLALSGGGGRGGSRRSNDTAPCSPEAPRPDASGRDARARR